MNVETIRLIWGTCVQETNIWQLHRATDMLFVTCHGLVTLPPVQFPALSLIYDRLSLAFHTPRLQLLAVILSCIRESFSDFDVANNNNNFNDTIDHNRPYILIVWNKRLNHESPEKIKNYHILWTRSSVCSYIYPIRSTYPRPRPTPWSKMNYVTTTIIQDKPHIW